VNFSKNFRKKYGKFANLAACLRVSFGGKTHQLNENLRAVLAVKIAEDLALF
jgi:hypothetical protein